MQFHTIKTPFEFLVIDNFYTQEELEQIWVEINALTPNLLAPQKIKSAKEKNTGRFLRNGLGIYVDEVFSDRNKSVILSLNRKVFSEVVIEKLKSFNPFYKLFAYSTNDYTLLNYYEDGNFYDPHVDSALFTTVTMLYHEPKKFLGGNLIFSEHDIGIECINNRLILFPSVVEHNVTNVSMENKYRGMGRYSITQFIHYNSLK